MSDINGVMMQYFHWYTPADGTLWKQLIENAAALADSGITAVWLPPAFKGNSGADDVGYGVYDFFDLGEFDQKGSVRTKYGTRDEYLNAIRSAQAAKMQVYADIEINHKMGADFTEECKAIPFDQQNRNRPIGELQTIKAWTHFTFPGRKGKYSAFLWHWWHFNAADFNVLDDKKDTVYLFEGKSFDKCVDLERGNFDYLMGCDLDFSHPEVQKELYTWGEWYLETTGVDGFRFDAVKHVKSSFFPEWMNYLRKHSNRKLFAVGEYWSNQMAALRNFIKITRGGMMLFDPGLYYNFAYASVQGKDYNLQQIFDNTLVKEYPDLAVTFVCNHDAQPLRPLEPTVEAWFKPLAYALILLRRDGYPCVFSADYYGAEYKAAGKDGKEYEISMTSFKAIIDTFLSARKKFAWGDQVDYFDQPGCVGWVRKGDAAHPGGLAVLMSNGAAASKKMQTTNPGKRYIDITGSISESVTTNKDGWGTFRCNAGSVAVWIPK